MITRAQHVEWGTWWAGEDPAPQSVLDARKAHGLGPNGEEDYECPGSSSSESETSSETTPSSTGSDEQSPPPAPNTAGRSTKARAGSITARSAGTSSTRRKG